MVFALLSLGSNIDNRINYIMNAINSINNISNLKIIDISSIYETYPITKISIQQNNYLNLIILIKTNINCFYLLSKLQIIENLNHRVRTIKWGSRTLDIDILTYGNMIINNYKLIIPHPLMHKRLFIMKPVVEIAPNFIHPIIKNRMNFILYKLLIKNDLSHIKKMIISHKKLFKNY